MRNADADLELRGVGPQGCEAAARPLGKRVVGRMERVVGSTPFRPCGGRGSLDKMGKTKRVSPRRGGATFGRASRSTKRLSDTECPFAGAGSEAGWSEADWASAERTVRSRCSISQRANHGVGVFIEPLVEQG